jgi:hypothetical protein
MGCQSNVIQCQDNLCSCAYLYPSMTREEIEQKMDELARKYVETHDKKIVEELYELACELGKMLKESSD